MTRSEREQIIQRYLTGEMSSAEEGDFFIQVALDRELRHDLQAQQTIENAFRKEREAERVGHTALRTRVASILAAAPPSMSGESSPTGAPPPSEVPAPALPAAGVKGGAIVGWSALVACVVTVVVALLLADPFGSRPAPPPASVPLPARQHDASHDAPGSVITPGASSTDVETPSSPAVTTPVSPTPPAPQARASTPPTRSDAHLPERSARTRPVTASSHEASEDTGTRPPDPAADKMKVGVRVQIKPQQ